MEKSVTLPRTNLKIFLNIPKPEEENKGKPSGETKEDAQMRRSTEVARPRGKNMKQLLQYYVSSTSYLLNKEGLMTTKECTCSGYRDESNHR